MGTVKVNEVFGGAPGGSAQPRGESGHGFGYGPELLDEFTRVKVVHVAAPPAMTLPGQAAPAPGITPAEAANRERRRCRRPACRTFPSSAALPRGFRGGWQRNSPAVTVVGDFMLDGWWSGSIDRMCREAPLPWWTSSHVTSPPAARRTPP